MNFCTRERPESEKFTLLKHLNLVCLNIVWKRYHFLVWATSRQTHRHTDITTYRLNWPRGLFRENPVLPSLTPPCQAALPPSAERGRASADGRRARRRSGEPRQSAHNSDGRTDSMEQQWISSRLHEATAPLGRTCIKTPFPLYRVNMNKLNLLYRWPRYLWLSQSAVSGTPDRLFTATEGSRYF